MSLVPIGSRPEAAKILYELLKERTPEQSISHKKMPSWEEHIRFIASRPYEQWWLIEENPGIVGSAYLTRSGEIGIFIFERYAHKGFGEAAVADIRFRYPKRRLIANVNPMNEASRNFFEKKFGGKVIQITYELA